jgi:nudix-type nucleoside diphosphatase (YffH/AdpP family)
MRPSLNRIERVPARILSSTILHEGFCKLIRVRLRLPDGDEIDREVEDHGASVAMLPYDPVRRTALLIRLLRAPVLLTANMADLLEAPAGLVDEDMPADAARRELHEEAGLAVTDLEHVGTVWTMPGISTERMDLYLARYSEADRVGAGGGVAGESENITVVEMPLSELWAKAQGGGIADMKTLTLILLLHEKHPELF